MRVFRRNSTVRAELVRDNLCNGVIANFDNLLALLIVEAEKGNIAIIETNHELILLVVQPLTACGRLLVGMVCSSEVLGLTVFCRILPNSYLVFGRNLQQKVCVRVIVQVPNTIRVRSLHLVNLIVLPVLSVTIKIHLRALW